MSASSSLSDKAKEDAVVRPKHPLTLRLHKNEYKNATTTSHPAGSGIAVLVQSIPLFSTGATM
jgi:hypothetical protein